MKSFLLPVLFFLLTWSNLSFAQVKNPADFPPRTSWHELPLLAQDTIVLCMKYYFLSDDTIYFREAASEQVMKLALAEIGETDIFYGKDFHYAQISIGSKVKNNTFYSYYKNAAPFQYGAQKAFQQARNEAQQKELEQKVLEAALLEATPMARLQTFTPTEVGFILKNGCKILTEGYAFLSGDKYFFMVADQDMPFYIDTATVLHMQGIIFKKNYRFHNHFGYRFAAKSWLCLVVVGGPLLIASAGALAIWVTSTGASAIITTAGGGYIFYVVLKGAIRNVKRFNYYKKAQRYHCLHT
ncbi:MAG: hypothetical protein RI948_14 [Bacteroidota bacterium]|jgi:hypothetical protein